MARLLHQSVEAPRACVYLPGEQSSLEHRVMLDVTAGEYDAMLVRGWRRFGPVYFRPACAACTACDSLRLPVDRFAPTRSQRKARNRCAHLRRQVGPPKLDAARLQLYTRWHTFREAAREWPSDRMDARAYFEQFAFPHPVAREVAWYDGPRLVAVSLCDETPTAWSLVYFFFDPALARLSPGAANIVFAVEEARARGLAHVYLGYRVRGCASLRYKGRFSPHEQLLGRPGLSLEPTWTPVAPDREDSDTGAGPQ